MHEVLHHVIKRSQAKRNTSHIINLIDRMAYIMGAITVLVNIPQLISVWTSPDTQGVSLISWIGFSLGSLFWIAYGVLHKEKPIIAINTALVMIQGLIVVGILTR